MLGKGMGNKRSLIFCLLLAVIFCNGLCLLKGEVYLIPLFDVSVESHFL